MLSINTNKPALFIQANKQKSLGAINQAITRLSSGLRINYARDDAAGQAIINRMGVNHRANAQMSRGISDGLGVAQTAEGALTEINSLIHRARELAVYGADGSLDSKSRVGINNELKEIKENINHIATSTEIFRQKPLVATNQGDAKTIHVVVGAAYNGQIKTLDIKTTAADTKALGIEDSSLEFQDTASKALQEFDDALAKIDGYRSYYGALENRFASAISSIGKQQVTLSAAQSRVQDADYAKETSDLVRAKMLNDTGNTVLAQANQEPQLVMTLLMTV